MTVRPFYMRTGDGYVPILVDVETGLTVTKLPPTECEWTALRSARDFAARRNFKVG